MRTVRLLVASSADLSAKHSWRTDNSFLSTKKVGARIAELLMDLGAYLPSHERSLKSCVMSFNIEGVRLALTKLGDNVQLAVDQACGDRRTLLHYCAANAGKDGAHEITELLIQHHATVNAPASNGQTPLDMAVAYASTRSPSMPMDWERVSSVVSVVETLVRSGAARRAAPQFQSSSCKLSTAGTPGAAAISEMLLKTGMVLLWHPLLWESVRATDKEFVARSLKKMSDQMAPVQEG